MPECYIHPDDSSPYPITRDQALLVAIECYLCYGVDIGDYTLEVRDISEVARRPNVYFDEAIAALDHSWLVYAVLNTNEYLLCDSLVVLVDQHTGAVHFAGSARDEG